MCKPRYSEDRVTGNCCICFNRIETNMIKIAHEKITSEASGTMETSWKVWFGKKIMGTRYIENIADTGILPDRGPNELWTKGGILYVPPSR